MGGIWLGGLADILRLTGFPVIEYPGWRTRSRASGGFTSLNGLSIHHTAESFLMDGKPSADYNALGAPARPISNIYLDRGLHQPGGRCTFWCMAAGATNTVGAGSWAPAGISTDQGNPRSIGLEIGNNGIGEPYSEDQQKAVLACATEIYKAFGPMFGWDNADLTEIFSHFEYAPTRKCDPTGLSRWSNDGNKKGCNAQPRWNMNAFRAEVKAGLAPVPPHPVPVSKENELDYVMFKINGDASGTIFAGWGKALRDAGGNPTGQYQVPILHHMSGAEFEAQNPFSILRSINKGDLKGCAIQGPIPTGYAATDFANSGL